MAKAEIFSGICGFTTKVETKKNNTKCTLSIESECKDIKRLAEELTEVDSYREISFRGEGPETFEKAKKYCPHAACPVPVGIIKAIEIEAGLALPKDVTIKLFKSDK